MYADKADEFEDAEEVEEVEEVEEEEAGIDDAISNSRSLPEAARRYVLRYAR